MRTGMLALGIGIVAFCQSPPRPSFEVASIRPGGDLFSTKPEIAGGTLRWTTQLAYLVGYAYDLDFSKVTGTKKHLGSIYHIEATFDPSATNANIRLMAQSLLADRFKLQFHRSTTQGEGYALSVGKNGLKVREAAATDTEYITAILLKAGIAEVTGKSATMSQLAELLQRGTQTPVWDRTGVTGKYDFQFRYARDPDGASGDAPWLGTALQEALGINVQKQKGPVETLVVDQIEEPSEN